MSAAATVRISKPANVFAIVLLFAFFLCPELVNATWYVAASTSPMSGAGTISNPGTTSYADTMLSVDYRVTPAPGYNISAVRLNGAPLTPNGSGSYTVSKVSGTGNLVAYFAGITYRVTLSVTGSGAIAPSFSSPAPTALAYGNNYTFNILPNYGYKIDDLLVDEVSQGPVSTYTFEAINANHTLSASFSIAPKVVASVTPPFTAQTTGFGLQYGVLLDATKSTTTLGSLSYLWSVVSTNPVGLTGGAFDDPTAGKTTFYADKSGEYTVQVDVSDGLGHSSKASLVVKAQPRQIYVSADCIACHRDATPPMSTRVFDYVSSVHSSTTVTPVACGSCHNPDSNLGHPYLYEPVGSCAPCHTTYTPQVLTEHGLSPHASANVGCVGCHSGHAVKKGFTGSFCQGCHTGLFQANSPHKGLATQLQNLCRSCHSAHLFTSAVPAAHFNGYTSTANVNFGAAYVTPATQCANCHLVAAGVPNPPVDAGLLQQRLDWAGSGHGNVKGKAWLVQDFKTVSGCVQCHTTTGFIAYSTTRVTSAWGSPSSARDVLSCNACHTDIAAGTVRKTIPLQPYVDDSYVNPDLGSISNLCLECHSGTHSGRSIKARAVAGADFTNVSFISAHSSAAAGILFKSIGYEFSGRDYSNKWHLKHDRIGKNHFNAYRYDSGTAGPCAGCHMSSANKHSFSPLTKDANGIVTGILSDSCAGCHTGPAYLNASRMNTRKTKFATVLLVLQKTLEARGIHYSDTPPYSSRLMVTPIRTMRLRTGAMQILWVPHSISASSSMNRALTLTT